MDNDDLDKLLRRAKVPERDDGYWAFFPRRITARLRQQPGSVAPARKAAGWRELGIGLALACLVIGFIAGAHFGTKGTVAGRGPVVAADPLAASRKMYQELNAEFPDQIRAIIIEGTEMRLVLSDKAEPPASKPLWLKICRGGQCRSLITFSGQKVQLGGHSYEVLTDGQDGVILVGDDLVWSSVERAAAGGDVHIQATVL